MFCIGERKVNVKKPAPKMQNGAGQPRKESKTPWPAKNRHQTMIVETTTVGPA